MPHTALTKEGLRDLRNTVILGIQYLATTVKEKKAGDKYWNGFFDVELGVSTNPLTSSNCENLSRDESAYFIRVKDVMPNLASEPKSVLFGVVMTKKLDTPPHEVRMWSDIPPKWETGGDTLSKDEKDEIVRNVMFDILDNITRACDESGLPSEMIVP